MKSFALINYFLALTNGQEDILGACPHIVDSWDDEEKGKLDIKRLSGHRRNTYDITDDAEQDCVAIKLV